MMFLLSFLVIGLMALPNIRLAQKIGQNGVLWGFISILFYFIFQIIFGMILFAFTYKGAYEMNAMKAYLNKPPAVFSLAVVLFGIGGILLARYILERIGKQNKRL